MTARPDDKQDLIMDAAIRVFNTRGFAQTRLSDVADEAGVAKGTLYLYFSSKEDLFREAMMREFRRYEGETGRIAGDTIRTKAEKLHDMCKFHLKYFAERRNWRFWMMNHFEHDEATNAALMRFLQGFLERVVRIMEGDVVDELAMIRATAFMGVLEGFKNELFRLPDHVTDAEWIEARAGFTASLFSNT